jgi:hypothetical protein
MNIDEQVSAGFFSVAFKKILFMVRPRPRGHCFASNLPARARAHHREIIFFLKPMERIKIGRVEDSIQ